MYTRSKLSILQAFGHLKRSRASRLFAIAIAIELVLRPCMACFIPFLRAISQRSSLDVGRVLTVKLGFVYALMWSLIYLVVSNPGGSQVTIECPFF
jgi:hypothetical protein